MGSGPPILPEQFPTPGVPPHMDHLAFDNRFVTELPGDPELSRTPRQVFGAAWSPVDPTPVREPVLLAHSPEMAEALGFTAEDVASPRFSRVFGGNELLPGMRPFSAAYGGHQFGHWAGQLGDGRAITLGEVVTPSGDRWELQLKGAGLTPYSRTADGRAVLRSSIREFLCSEAMHHLGIPTTRALSLVGTGERVVRDMFYDGNPEAEPGAIVCRVAPSFLRPGNYQLFASRGEIDLLARLVDFTIDRDFPELKTMADPTERRAHWLLEVCRRTADLMVHWMRVGFVHGVMNTDNLSILGLTIDYGPYGWLDDFDPDWTPNTTDAQGRRYRYAHQPAVAQWNLTRFAEALHPLLGEVAPLEEAITEYVRRYNEGYLAMTAGKVGLARHPARGGAQGDEARVRKVVDGLYPILHTGELDFTLFFRLLGDGLMGEGGATGITRETFREARYDEEKGAAVAPALTEWLGRWREALAEAWPEAEGARIREAMHRVNPRYVLRNYLAQEAIDLAEEGDLTRVHELLNLMRRPYDDQPGKERFAARRPEWARRRAGCSMLSCSS